jgi:hypothetical protein
MIPVAFSTSGLSIYFLLSFLFCISIIIGGRAIWRQGGVNFREEFFILGGLAPLGVNLRGESRGPRN